MWLRNNPNYKSKRLEYTQNEKLKPNSLEHFISFTDFIYKNNYILVEKPSEFEGEENYINESRSLELVLNPEFVFSIYSPIAPSEQQIIGLPTA